MKFLVLLYATFIVQCEALKMTSESEGYLAGFVSANSWAGYVKRFYVLILIIPGLVLYYVPKSRYYARRACHIAIDLVANGLKAALNVSFGNEACVDVGRISYYSDRFVGVPDIQDSAIFAHARKDRVNPPHTRRRHRVKQDSKIEEDKAREHDRRRHRHSEHRSRYAREEKIRNGQLQSPPKIVSCVQKEPEIRSQSSHPLHFYPEGTTDGFYYPGTQRDDAKYSTSFVISGIKATTESNCEEEIAADEDEGLVRPQMICKQRSRPSKRATSEDAIYPENDGPTRDCESFLLTELDYSRSYDIDPKIGFSATNLDYPEKEGDVSSHKGQPRQKYSATPNTLRECDDTAEDLKTDIDERTLDQKAEDVEDEEDGEPKSATKFSPAEGNHGSRAKEGTFPPRKVIFQKKEKEISRKKVREDEDNRVVNTNSEEVFEQLGDQIAKLEKTIRMMKPEMTKKERGNRTREDYAVRNIETVLKDMKRTFSKVDERVESQRRPSPCREKIKERVRHPFHSQTESATSVVDEDLFSVQPSQGKTPEEDSLASEEDLTILQSEVSLEDEEELSPIITNRVKPYLIRTFDWLFTGCPGVTAAKKYTVGKEEDSKDVAERVS